MWFSTLFHCLEKKMMAHNKMCIKVQYNKLYLFLFSSTPFLLLHQSLSRRENVWKVKNIYGAKGGSVIDLQDFSYDFGWIFFYSWPGFQLNFFPGFSTCGGKIVFQFARKSTILGSVCRESCVASNLCSIMYNRLCVVNFLSSHFSLIYVVFKSCTHLHPCRLQRVSASRCIRGRTPCGVTSSAS